MRTMNYRPVLVVVFTVTGAAIVAGWVAGAEIRPGSESASFSLAVVAALLCLVGVGFLVNRILRRASERLDSIAVAQGEFLDGLPSRFLPLAIVAAAGLGLFLELSLIRWQAGALSILAFYKNFTLLAAFAGLGIGYAAARRKAVALYLVLPMLSVQLMLYTLMGTSSTVTVGLNRNPIAEQLTMGIPQATNAFQYSAVYLTLASVFITTALMLIPIGQATGRLMFRLPNLSAYGLNLLGSLLGVLVSYGLAALWSPPAVWFALVSFLVLVFLARTCRTLALSAMIGLAGLALLVVGQGGDAQEIYSPYQRLEHREATNGGMVVTAAGHFLLTASDLSTEGRAPEDEGLALYYEFPYEIAGYPERVLVVGAGAGNDVAAALRAGATSVDAVEIDPVVAELGRRGHPEQPYSDPRTTLIVNDARSFMRTTAEMYDMIVYGLLDSHGVLSHGSSVRMDSFVYTVEAFEEARALLAEDGVISLSFAQLTPELAIKLRNMLAVAFDGRPPLVVQFPENASLVYLQGNHNTVSFANALTERGLVDVSVPMSELSAAVDLATDDWPFLYMTRRVYPLSYLVIVALIVLITVWLTRSQAGNQFEFGSIGFFFLGAGFLLVETKAITELGLAFGNTWQVIGVVIAGVLVMAFLANLLVQNWLNIPYSISFGLLFASLLAGYVVAGNGLPSGEAGRWLAVVLLTSPVFFSGVIFSRALHGAANVSGALAINLIGSIVGGVLEYSSMRFGFQALYLLGAALYVLAAVAIVRPSLILRLRLVPARLR